VEEAIRSKNVHVKLDRLTHAEFKAGLTKIGASMQEAFEEFAKCFVAGDKSALRLIERLKRQQIKDELSVVGLKPGLGRKRRVLDELDPETLYDLINEEEEKDEDPLPAHG